jgi:hypothetical protein
MDDIKKHIYFEPKGRLGNALFRYFAILLILKSNSHLTYGGVNRHRNGGVIIIDDNSYKNIISNNHFQLENKNTNLLLNGFYQLQEFANYRDEIKSLLHGHREDIIYNYPYEEFKISDIITKPTILNIYDIVIHIRLEDFVNNNEFIRHEYIINLLNKITSTFFSNNKTAIVVNKPKSSFELNYIETVKLWFNTNNIPINIESNDIITDFHIMKHAKKLICSNSTVSWCAALLSDNIEICYMPDYKITPGCIHQTLKAPIKNTILYSIYQNK